MPYFSKLSINSQMFVGSVCYPQKLAIRLVAGFWCLSAFVLVNSYSSTLVSFVTSPNNKPIIKSIYELPKKPHVHIVVEEDKALDIIFSVP